MSGDNLRWFGHSLSITLVIEQLQSELLYSVSNVSDMTLFIYHQYLPFFLFSYSSVG